MSVRTKRNLKAFEAEYNEQQKRAQFESEAPMREAAAKLSTLQAEVIAAEQRAVRDTVFTKPSSALAGQCTPYTKNLTAEQVQVAISNSVSALKLHLSEKGITLTNAGLAKIGQVVEVNGATMDITEPSELRKIYDYLDANDCFTDRDREITVQVETPAKAQTEATEDIDEALQRCDTRTAEGRAKVKKLGADAIAIEARPLWGRFCAFMRNTYHVPMDAEQSNAVIDFCYNSGKGITAKSLNEARQVVLQCRTADEELARTIEQHDQGSVGEYSVRRDVANRVRTLLPACR